MTHDEVVISLREAYANGEPFSSVFRRILKDKSVGISDLYGPLTEAFGVAFGDVTILGGWEPEGNSPEVPDERLDYVIMKAIADTKRK